MRQNHSAIKTDQELQELLKSCKKGIRNSQDELYKLYYGYAMGICLRYSKHREEAVEIVNDGFMKVFNNLGKYTAGKSFKGWVRRIMINAAIDYYRKNEKHYNMLDISYAQSQETEETALEQLSVQEIINAIQQLPASYRMVFNLFVIEGYKHEEIAAQLNITAGTSKSNLSIARSKLQKILNQNQQQLIPKQNG
ncbi:sigma-70 family RNA polymerase sigma factor [Fulvivirga lutimaris]|uniref:RNA polymerase sigma factor n=1 Tax=Fulvivirga lutimaris TaxID=1819566 RepID=UPI0031B5D98D